MKKSILSLSILSALCLSGNVVAQEQAQEESVERITIRGAIFGQQVAGAVKTPTLLLNVPQSASIIGEAQIEEQGLFSVADAMQYTPGVSIGLGEDHRDQITIRGQNTTADFFVDGLRDDVQYFRPLYNVERIEIMRGSNALLFGRGGGGGVVNRVTKTADVSSDFTVLSGNIDTFSAGGITLDTNVVIDKDQAFRLNAAADSVDNHRDFKDGSRYAFNPTWYLALSDVTSLNASYEYVNDDRLVDRGIPSLNGKPLNGVYDTFFGDKDFNNTTLEAHIARVKLDHKLSAEWSVNTTVQFADYDKAYQNLYPTAFDDESQFVTLDGYRDTTQRENFLWQLNAIGQFDTGAVSHTVLAGAEYADQSTENARMDNQFLENGSDKLSFMFSDPLVVPAHTLTAPVRDRASDVSVVSAFVQDEIGLGDNWVLVAGLRYDSFNIDVTDQIEINDGAEDGNSGLLSSDDSEISPRFGVIFKPAEDISLYASYSVSFLPRSGDQFLTLSLSSAALDAEEFRNTEVGFKWNLTDSLNLSAAAFKVERENGATVDPDNPEVSQLTGTETQGFELQLSGYITDSWSVTGGYSYLDGNQTSVSGAGSGEGQRLAQLPEHMFSVWNKFLIDEKWQWGLGIVHQSEQYASLSNNVTLPSFTRFDAAVFYTHSDALSLQLNVNNVLDTQYFPSAHNDNNISTGAPLHARVAATYRF